MANKMIKNDEAVSPIVATLVLIVVAIIGAAAVGILLGAFSNNVSNQATTQEQTATNGVDAGTILCAGSTTCQPVVTDLAALYMKENPNVKITVQGGGSGAGKTSIGQGLVDIGMSSEAWATTDAAKYPNVQVTQIGGRGVVFVYGNGSAGSLGHVTMNITDLQTDFDDTSALVTTAGTGDTITTLPTAVAVRAESSGTMDTAGKYLYTSTTYSKIYTTKTGKTAYTGNPGVVGAVVLGTAAAPVLGVIDFGYYSDSQNMRLVDISDAAANVYIANSTTIKQALKDKTAGATQGAPAKSYAQGLVSGLYLMTNGAPTPLQQSFINYVKSPAAMTTFSADGVYSMYDLQ